jgi:hypothetical protein
VLLAEPPLLYSNRGWRDVETDEPAEPPFGGALRRALEQAWLSSPSLGSTSLCLLTFDGVLERWDLSSGERELREEVPGARSVQALTEGCAVVTEEGSATVHRRGQGPRTLPGKALALAADGEGLLLATEEGLARDDGRRLAKLGPPREGTSAVGRIGARVALGFKTGRIELLEARGEGRRATLELPAACQDQGGAVTRITPGPAETIIAGYHRGLVGVWDSRTGALLFEARLRGEPAHLLLAGTKLHAASDVGDRAVLDLSTLTRDRCELLREVWEAAPFAWDDGRAVPRPAPRPGEHECAR